MLPRETKREESRQQPGSGPASERGESRRRDEPHHDGALSPQYPAPTAPTPLPRAADAHAARGAQFPHILLDFLTGLGLDPYEEYEGRPTLSRAPKSFFPEGGSSPMILAGWPSCSPPQGHVDDGSLEHETEGPGASAIKLGQTTAREGIWFDVLVGLHHAKMTPSKEDDVTHTVECCMVGIPMLMDKPSLAQENKHDIFEHLIKASQGEGVSGIISTPSMQAALEYKWRTYCKSRWRMRVVEFVVFAGSYLPALAVLSRADPADASRRDQRLAMLVLLYVAQIIGLSYTMREVLQLKMMGAFAYLVEDTHNPFDVAQLLIQYFLTVAYTWREYSGSRELERPFKAVADPASIAGAPIVAPTGYYQDESVLALFSALGAVLTFVRFMSVMRGSSNLAYLLLMIRVIIRDMIPFCIIMIFFLITFGFSMVILTSDEHAEFSNGEVTFFSSYLSPMMGNFARSTYEHDWVKMIYLIYFTMFANIVMLNMLIAIMGESYGRVRETSGDLILLERAKLILEEQDFIVYGDHLLEQLQRLLQKLRLDWFGWITKRQAARTRRRALEYPAWLHCLAKRRYQTDAGEEVWEDVRALLDEMRSRQRSTTSPTVGNGMAAVRKWMRVIRQQQQQPKYPGSVDAQKGALCEVLEQASNPKWLSVRMTDGRIGLVARSKLEEVEKLPDPSDDEDEQVLVEELMHPPKAPAVITVASASTDALSKATVESGAADS